MTCLSEMRVPPHQGLVPEEDTSPTCHGYSLTSVSWPPTILFDLLGIPHSQAEFPPLSTVVVVTGSCVVVVVLLENPLGSDSIKHLKKQNDIPFPI